jgi:hypothetical protein
MHGLCFAAWPAQMELLADFSNRGQQCTHSFIAL